MDEAANRPEIIWTNVVFFLVWTLLTVVAVPWYAMTHGVTWMEIAACILLWFVTGLSITAGYRFQNIDFRHAFIRTYVLTPEPLLVSSEPTRIQSDTKGFTAGVAYSF